MRIVTNTNLLLWVNIYKSLNGALPSRKHSIKIHAKYKLQRLSLDKVNDYWALDLIILIGWIFFTYLFSLLFLFRSFLQTRTCSRGTFCIAGQVVCWFTTETKTRSTNSSYPSTTKSACPCCGLGSDQITGSWPQLGTAAHLANPEIQADIFHLQFRVYQPYAIWWKEDALSSDASKILIIWRSKRILWCFLLGPIYR